MANFKISQLPELSPLPQTAEVMVIYNGRNYRTQVSNIKGSNVENNIQIATTLLKDIPLNKVTNDGNLIESIYKCDKNILHTTCNPKFLILDNEDNLNDIEALEIATKQSKSFITSYLIPYIVKEKLLGYKEYVYTGEWKLLYDPSVFLTREEADETYLQKKDYITQEEYETIFK